MMMVWMKKTATRHVRQMMFINFVFFFSCWMFIFFHLFWQEKMNWKFNRVFLPRFDPVFGMAL